MQGVLKLALQISEFIQIYLEHMYILLNCYNVARHTEYHLG
jgi:hypothetical protein